MSAETLEAAREQALHWRQQAQGYRAKGQHQEACAAYQQAAQAALQAADPLLAAQVQIGWIDSLGWLGKYEEATALGRRMEQELKALGAEDEAAKVLVNLGNLHLRRDRYAEALTCYEAAQEIFARGEDSLALARVQGNSAHILTHFHREEEAIALYEQARATFTAQELPIPAAMVEANIGFLHAVSGRYVPALSALSRARETFATRELPLETATCDLDAADVYRALNLHTEAETRYREAASLFATLGIDYEQGKAESGLAAILVASGHPAEAQAALERAEERFRAQRNTLRVAHVRLVRATLLRGQGETEAACQAARAAEQTFARRHLPGWAAEARFLLAAVALETGESGLRRMQAVARSARRTGRGWLEAQAEQALGRFLLRQGEPAKALRHLRAGVATLEAARTQIAPEELHVAFLRDKLALYEDLLAALLERGRPDDIAEALEVVERAKSRLLLERVQAALEARTAGLGETSEPLQARLASLRAELSRGYHQIQAFGEEARRLAGNTPQSWERLAPLEAAYATALREAELAAPQSALSGLASVASLEEIRAALPPDETLVEFFLLQGQVGAFVLTSTETKVVRDLAPLAEVGHIARRLRYHLQKAGMMLDYARRYAQTLDTALREALQALYDLLLKPLTPHIRGEKLILIPQGPLHGLPFHACYDGTQYALDRWEIVYAPSATVWLWGAKQSTRSPEFATLPALLMGVSEPGLPRVGAEIASIAPLLRGSQVFHEAAATVETFQQWASRCRLLHIATHALYRADNPLFSGLRLADGWLLARDLYEMRLDCDLVTLSACRTGVASVEPGDELFGLLRGFLAAGARSLAASLWPADDAATADLMARFYTFLTQGETKAASLRKAQQETRAQYPHPYHWAAFVMLGSRQ